MEDKVPVFDLADRLRKALRESGMTVRQMAAYLDVTESSVSRWINGKSKPTTSTLRDWSRKTNISYDWLVNG